MPFGGLLTVGLIGAGSSIFGGITQAHAADKASQQQAQAEQNALDFQKQQWNQTQANQAPWLRAGQGAVTNLASMLDPNAFARTSTYGPGAAMSSGGGNWRMLGNRGGAQGAPMGASGAGPSNYSPYTDPSTGLNSSYPVTMSNGQTITGYPEGQGPISYPNAASSMTDGAMPSSGDQMFGQGGASRGGFPNGASGGGMAGGMTIGSSMVPQSMGASPSTTTSQGYPLAPSGQPGAAGSLLQPFTAAFQAPTNVGNTPGYKFALEQGENAIQNGASSRGNLLTGQTAADMAQFATGLASQTYQQQYQNAQQEYGNAFNIYNQNGANTFNRTASLAGLGQTAAGSLGNTGAQAASSIGGTYGNIGNAQAAGTIGAGNAQSGMATNIGNAFQQSLLMNYINQNGGFNGNSTTSPYPGYGVYN